MKILLKIILLSFIGVFGLTTPAYDKNYNKLYLNNVSDTVKNSMLKFETTAELDITKLSRQQKLDINTYINSIVNEAVDEVSAETGVEYFLSSWETKITAYKFNIGFTYSYGKEVFEEKKQQYKLANNKASEIIEQLIKPNMTEFERELAIHDYIVNNTVYDSNNVDKNTVQDESYSVYGVLINNIAVCEGYARTMNLLLGLAGIESMMVTGEARTADGVIGHAWNIVKIDGKYYHVDVTWDDPVLTNGEEALIYDFFNITDLEIEKDHTWDKKKYPQCTDKESNYFYKKGLLVRDYKQFVDMVKKGVLGKKNEILVKVTNFDKNDYEKLDSVVFFGDSLKSFSYSINERLGVVAIRNLKYN